MAFSVFQDLFAEVDAATSVFVSDVVARLIVELTPVVTVGLTLTFIVYGLAIIRGAVDLPVMDFLGRAVRIGIITSIALAGAISYSRSKTSPGGNVSHSGGFMRTTRPPS